MQPIQAMRATYWKALGNARQYLSAADARLKPLYIPWQQRGNQGCLAVDIHARVGFFAQLNWTLSILAHCERYGLRPYIQLTSPAYAEYEGEDWFGTYFSNIALTDADRLRIQRGKITVSRISDIEQLGLPNYESDFTLESAHRLLDRHVRVQPGILDYVGEYVRQQFAGERVLGVHYRGTDKGSEAPRVSLEECLQAVSLYLDRHPETTAIFLASDESSFIDAFRHRCSRARIITHDDQARSRDGLAIHTRPLEGQGNPRGMEALVNSLLLSRCDGLVRTASFLSAWSSVFNPEIPVVMLNRPYANKLWFPDREIARRAEFLAGTEPVKQAGMN